MIYYCIDEMWKLCLQIDIYSLKEQRWAFQIFWLIYLHKSFFFFFIFRDIFIPVTLIDSVIARFLAFYIWCRLGFNLFMHCFLKMFRPERWLLMILYFYLYMFIFYKDFSNQDHRNHYVLYINIYKIYMKYFFFLYNSWDSSHTFHETAKKNDTSKNTNFDKKHFFTSYIC